MPKMARRKAEIEFTGNVAKLRTEVTQLLRAAGAKFPALARVEAEHANFLIDGVTHHLEVEQVVVGRARVYMVLFRGWFVDQTDGEPVEDDAVYVLATMENDQFIFFHRYVATPATEQIENAHKVSQKALKTLLP